MSDEQMEKSNEREETIQHGVKKIVENMPAYGGWEAQNKRIAKQIIEENIESGDLVSIACGFDRDIEGVFSSFRTHRNPRETYDEKSDFDALFQEGGGIVYYKTSEKNAGEHKMPLFRFIGNDRIKEIKLMKSKAELEN